MTGLAICGHVKRAWRATKCETEPSLGSPTAPYSRLRSSERLRL